jgi:hypothetical protein
MVVLHTRVGNLAIIYQFLLAVLLLLHRPHLRLRQKLGNIKRTEKKNKQTNKFHDKFTGYPYY